MRLKFHIEKQHDIVVRDLSLDTYFPILTRTRFLLCTLRITFLNLHLKTVFPLIFRKTERNFEVKQTLTDCLLRVPQPKVGNEAANEVCAFVWELSWEPFSPRTNALTTEHRPGQG